MNTESRLVPITRYQKAFTQFDQLHTQLSEGVVRSFASEVLGRLTELLGETKADSSELKKVCDALIDRDSQKAARLIEKHLQEGADVQSLYLNFLAPAAQQLGHWWEDDRITFADVTVGTGRVYAIMRSLTERFPPPRVNGKKSAFFAPVPGDDHKLGLRMATDLIRKTGWEIDLCLADTHDTVLKAIMASDHHLIGISGAGEHSLESLAKLVLAIRFVRPRAYVLVSGNIVNTSPDKLALMDLDSMDATFDGAISELDRLWRRLSSEGLKA
ncbi:MAG: cobalamin-dependent protein [Sulfitobacter sp.]|nr:cobalamin-dependent protein [Sulfitobacter sp.]